jgi:hypothetical protein
VLKFAVILFPASVIAPSQSAEQIMEELRSNALGTAGGEQLVRLDSLPNGVLQRSKGVIIFLHGLLSIDIGLFDEIIRLLRQDKRFGTQYALVGWPHDTPAIPDEPPSLVITVSAALAFRKHRCENIP